MIQSWLWSLTLQILSQDFLFFCNTPDMPLLLFCFTLTIGYFKAFQILHYINYFLFYREHNCCLLSMIFNNWGGQLSTNLSLWNAEGAKRRRPKEGANCKLYNFIFILTHTFLWGKLHSLLLSKWCLLCSFYLKEKFGVYEPFCLLVNIFGVRMCMNNSTIYYFF